MRNAETILAAIEDRGRRGLVLDRVYRELFNEDQWLRAYSRLASNQGAMTRGVTNETVDGTSMLKIRETIEKLRKERYQWTPVRRVLIPKGNGKTRPLGIPTWTDKWLQEVMRALLEALYEPQFSPNSHGFRPGRGCHTALKDIFHGWTGTKWFIEGDIKGCFDNIDHSVLLNILRERIYDGRFLNLVAGLLKAGYMEEWRWTPTLSGTPQGGIISPLLANIYLDKLDKFVENTLIPEYTKGKTRRQDPMYTRFSKQISTLRRTGGEGHLIKQLLDKRKKLPFSMNQMDPDHRRLRYIRYADDFLLAFVGPKDEAEAIKVRIGDFLRDHLKLEMSPEKTKITHAAREKARFLGYDIGADNRRLNAGKIKLRVPAQKIEDKITRYTDNGRARSRPELHSDSDFAIVAQYGSEYRGFVNYYAFAENRFWLNRLKWLMASSMHHTLAGKHKSSVSKMASKYGVWVSHRGTRQRAYRVIIEREGREPLVAQFGGICLKPEPYAILPDNPLGFDTHVTRNDLLDRLLADECQLCGSNEKVQVHHIRKLADIKVSGKRELPTWQRVMIARHRKTLVVCEHCHIKIHMGEPTRVRRAGDV